MLKGQVALVTGGSGLIGSAIAQTLSKARADVAVQYGTNARESDLFTVHADLSKPGFEFNLLEKVRDRFGPVSILVNCAADQAIMPFDDISNEQMAQMLQVNVTAILMLSKAFAGQVPESGGVITNISSIEGQQPAKDHGHYSASKAALDSLTKSFAIQFADQGVRCNGVAPGLIKRQGLEQAWPDGVARWKAACPSRRLGTPDDIAEAVLFLSSPKASWINGATLNVDGGVSAAGGW